MKEPVAIDFSPALSQPELISEADARLLRVAKAWKHTGRTTLRDEATVAAIFAGLQRGFSRRQIATSLQVSRNTVTAVEHALETSGELEPLQQRVMRAMSVAASESLAWVDEIVSARKLSPEAAAMVKALWVGVGITSDKCAAATGGGLAADQGAELAISPNLVVDEYRRLMAIDCESVVSTPNTLNGNGSTAIDTTKDTTGPNQATGPEAQGGRAMPVPSGAEGPAKGGGGGCRAGGGRE